jgi:ankyrin repeat protein
MTNDQALFMKTNNVNIAKTLVESGKVDINYRDSDGETKLYYAARKNNFDMFKMLVNYGVEDKLDGTYGKVAYLFSSGNNKQFIRIYDVVTAIFDIRSGKFINE